ncbi:response regulator [Phormidium sp. LEGE 05292]|uniref:response regulator n=1 Tax=[Phormidium] sp. LEGE 05292 TaxID=767427 RepID=UPI00187F6DEE|nr:response regulator [Phormidium sp. LEGE 05292]MBE9229754.1 response regulator [Phormidium sp. LEGE 05292]
MVSSPSKAQLKRILIVDDMQDNISLLEAILVEEGYIVDTANSGKAALAKVQTTPPDLILLDAMMPGMDGLEVTRRIREQKDLPFIPILLITAYENLNAAEALDIGANDFVRKPIEYDELMARVRASLRLKTT